MLLEKIAIEQGSGHMFSSDIKNAILLLIITQLETAVQVAEQAVKVACDTATHKDCLGSSKYETMGTEASYLAQGQGIRLLELERALAYFKQLKLSPCTKATLSALIVLENTSGKEQILWLAADAGGLHVDYKTMHITVITTQSPLGRALLGHEVGDVIELQIAGKIEQFEVLTIA